jgi:hypothetical protein
MSHTLYIVQQNKHAETARLVPTALQIYTVISVSKFSHGTSNNFQIEKLSCCGYCSFKKRKKTAKGIQSTCILRRFSLCQNDRCKELSTCIPKNNN